MDSISDSNDTSSIYSFSKEPSGTLCEVCKGIFHEASPRGRIITLHFDNSDWDKSSESTRESCPTETKDGHNVGDSANKERRYIYLHHQNMTILLASANHGCQMCRLIIGGLGKCEPNTSHCLWCPTFIKNCVGGNRNDFQALLATTNCVHSENHDFTVDFLNENLELVFAEVATRMECRGSTACNQSYSEGLILLTFPMDKRPAFGDNLLSGLGGCNTFLDVVTFTKPVFMGWLSILATPGKHLLGPSLHNNLTSPTILVTYLSA